MDQLVRPLRAIQVMSLIYCNTHSWAPWGSFAPIHAQWQRRRTRPQTQIQPNSSLRPSSPDDWCAEVASGRCPRPKSNSPRRWATAARLISKTSSQLHRGSQPTSRCHPRRHRVTSSKMILWRNTQLLRLPPTLKTSNCRWHCKPPCKQPTLEGRSTETLETKIQLTRARTTEMSDQV